MQLEEKSFYQITSLLNKTNSHYPLLESVLQGDMKGKVFADNLSGTRAALIINHLGWVYLIGDECPESFAAEVIEQLRNEGNFLWFGADKIWKDRIRKNISDDIKDLPRFHFEFNMNKFNTLRNIDYPCKIESITEENINRFCTKYEALHNFWNDQNVFLDKGFGYFIEENGEIISMILSAGINSQGAEIEIRTDENHRRKGHAKLLSIKFISRCISAGIKPKWDCNSKNTASVHLAQSLGFDFVEEYPMVFVTV